MRDEEFIEWLKMSLDPKDNERARWLEWLRAEQDKILARTTPKPRKRRRA